MTTKLQEVTVVVLFGYLMFVKLWLQSWIQLSRDVTCMWAITVLWWLDRRQRRED